jgi:hypothetical protein
MWLRRFWTSVCEAISSQQPDDLSRAAERRRALGFPEAIQERFVFLGDFGYHVVSAESTRVRYDGLERYVTFWHGRGSYAISAEFGRIDGPDDRVSLKEIWIATHPGSNDREIVAETPAEVVAGVRELAERVMSISGVLRGQIPYDTIRAYRRRLTDYYSRKSSINPD